MVDPNVTQTRTSTAGRPLFMLQGNGTVRNRGCEAILRTTLHMLREEFSDCRFVNAPHWPDWPAEYPKSPDVIDVIPPERSIVVTHLCCTLQRAKSIRKFKQAARYLPRTDAVLMLGGDNFTLDYFTPWPWLAAHEAVLDAGKPLVLWGASIGPFDAQPEFKRAAVEQLRRIHLILAREQESLEYLERLGISDNVRRVADPAFLLSPTPPHIDHPSLSLLQGPCLGVNLSPLLGQYRSDRHRWFHLAADVLRELLRSVHLPILLVPHVMQPFSNDYTFLYRIAERLRVSRRRLAVVPPIYDCGELKWIISKLTAFIGARTHSTVAALSSRVPTLCIGYSSKARGINRDLFGHADWVLPAASFSGGELIAKTRALLDQGDQIRQALVEPVAQARKSARRAAIYLRELLQAGPSAR